jgi:phenylalanyl-tRNA synthetase beta chain
MPIVSVGRDVLFARIGRTYTDKEFDELCFEFGIELDDVTSAREMYFRECGAKVEESEAAPSADVTKAAEALSDAVIYKVDIPANRYDLLSLEGLVRALRVFLSIDPLPTYGYLNNGEPSETIRVLPGAGAVRPFVVGAVIRGITFDEDTYNSFLDFQDKLHFTLCRRRTLVAIGTHDLDTVKGPFEYDARAPRDIRFRPLFQEREFTGDELWGHYQSDANFRSYMQIIGTGDADADRYPVITDSAGVVLSMPPVINGEHSKLTLATRNVLVECTATDLSKAYAVLNTIVCNFSQYATEQYKVERVKIIAADGSEHITPDLSSRTVRVSGNEVRAGIGAEIPTADMSALLTRMQLPTAIDGDELCVTVPALRTDVLHAIDIVEDVAIAYGYNNIVPTVPKIATVGSALPLNSVTDLLRGALAEAGWVGRMDFFFFFFCFLVDV